MIHISRILAYAMTGLGPHDIMREPFDADRPGPVFPNGAGPMLGDVFDDRRTPQGSKARKVQAPAALRVAPAPGRGIKR